MLLEGLQRINDNGFIVYIKKLLRDILVHPVSYPAGNNESDIFQISLLSDVLNYYTHRKEGWIL